MPTWESGCLSLMCFGFGKLWTLCHFDRNKPRNMCHDVPRNWGCTDISDLEVILRQGRVAGKVFYLLYHLSKWWSVFGVYLAIHSKIREFSCPKRNHQCLDVNPNHSEPLNGINTPGNLQATIDIPDIFFSFLQGLQIRLVWSRHLLLVTWIHCSDSEAIWC